MKNAVFICDNPQTIYQVYTREQIGDSPVLSTEELKKGMVPKSTEYLFSDRKSVV